MDFEWDQANRDHIAEHEVSCVEAEQVVRNNPVDLEFENDGYEERVTQLGETDAGRMLVVVWTWRSERIRMVTAFDAPRAMRLVFLRWKGGANGGRV